MCKTKLLTSELNALKARHQQILTGDMWTGLDKERLLVSYTITIKEKEAELKKLN